jgi:ribosomal-protein-alanine N-acetyltransferase
LRIRQFSKEDVGAVLAMQSKMPMISPWLKGDYLRLASDPGGIILVAELETTDPPKMLGFVAFRRVVDEAELHIMAVDPAMQRQGVGRELLREGQKRLLQAGAKRVFLEVRASNKPALELYYSAGFKLHSVRKDYYRMPLEDALVLSLDLIDCDGDPAENGFRAE